jgi:hypothetical protein
MIYHTGGEYTNYYNTETFQTFQKIAELMKTKLHVL